MKKRLRALSPPPVLEDDCIICTELLAPSSAPLTLACSHTFHGACIQQLVGPACPVCRAPITATQDGRITEADVAAMADRLQSHVRAHDEDALREYIQNDAHGQVPNYIALGSVAHRAMLRLLFAHVSARAFSTMEPDEVLPFLRNVGGGSSMEMRVLFAAECQAILKHNEPTAHVIDPDMVRWMCTHLVGLNPIVRHPLAHVHFGEDADCDALSRAELRAHAIVLGACLCENAFEGIVR